MDGKRKFIIGFAVTWMVVAAGLFLAFMLKYMDKQTFQVVFSSGFVCFSLVVFVLSFTGKKNGS
jgi:hypothetical protein